MRNLFGTDGIRGRMGSGLFVQQGLIQLGTAIARWAQKKYSQAPRILVLHDPRKSSSFVKAALKTGLLSYPVQLEDAGVLPTPAAAHFMKLQPSLDCAVIISASHNPYQDNGIKIIDSRTGKLCSEDEIMISSLCVEECSPSDTYGDDIVVENAPSLYCQTIVRHFTPNFLSGKRIVLDTAHGATYLVAPLIFRQLGAEVITLHDTPTGYNINEQCGALHTERLAAAVQAHAADAGFAFDGDGDRVMAINRHGEIRDGDDMLALLLTHPGYQATDHIVGTIMTNEGFAHYLQRQNKQLIRTAVGDKYIAEKLSTDKLLLGGEPSGHIILHDLLTTGDGILVALRLLEALCVTGNWDMHTFERYPQAMINVPVAQRKDLAITPFKDIIAHAQNDMASGRILVRYSGTENVLRVMVEALNAETAQTVCQQLAQQLSQVL